MAVQIFDNKKEAVDQLEAWLKNLPADTKSIQIAAFAYNDTYDGYNDETTKCRKQGDIWWVLSPEAQGVLLENAVSATLQQVSEFLSLPQETENDMLALKVHEKELRKSFKALARSFDMSIGGNAQDNIDTAAQSEEQLERLCSGVLAFENKDLYDLLMGLFSEYDGLKAPLDKMKWNLLTRGQKKKPTPAANKAPQVNKPIGKPAVPPQKPKAEETEQGESK